MSATSQSTSAAVGAAENASIYSLVKCLQDAQDLKYSTEMSRRKLKERLRAQFEQFRTNMDRLEANVLSQFSSLHIASQLDAPLNAIEDDLQKTIDNLSSLTLKSDAERKKIIENIERRANHYDQKISTLEQYKHNELDKLVNDRPDVNDFLYHNYSKLEQFLLEPTPTAAPCDVKWNKWDRNSWLVNIDQPAEADTFEIVDFSDDDDIDIELLVEPCNDTQMNSSLCSSSTESSDSGVARVFAMLASKPLDYWLTS